MVKEDEGLADDSGEEADGTVDTLAALLKVAEAAELEGFELGVYIKDKHVISFYDLDGKLLVEAC